MISYMKVVGDAGTGKSYMINMFIKDIQTNKDKRNTDGIFLTRFTEELIREKLRSSNAKIYYIGINDCVNTRYFKKIKKMLHGLDEKYSKNIVVIISSYDDLNDTEVFGTGE